LLFLLLLLFLGLAFAGLDIPLFLPCQVISSRPQEDRDCPRRFLPPTGLSHFRALSPHRDTPTNTPNVFSKPGLFNSWWVTAQTLPRMLASLVPGLQRLLLQGLCPTGHLSPVLANRPGHPCSSTCSARMT
jgi:hypothetical protein